MKLILTGSTGFLASEILTQALHHPSVTSIVALARSPVTTPSAPPENLKKLKSIVVKDYATYEASVTKEFEDADACIWTVAITPSKSRALPFQTVKEICYDWTIAGLRAILDANTNRARPLRFMYVSGSVARDPAKPHAKDRELWMPKSMAVYSKMRGETATALAELSAERQGQADVCVAKPGFITGGSGGVGRWMFGTALWASGLVETIELKEIAASLVESVVNGFEGTEGRLLNAEMVELGRGALRGKGALSGKEQK